MKDLQNKLDVLAYAKACLADEEGDMTASLSAEVKREIDKLDYAELYAYVQSLETEIPPVAVVWGDLVWQDMSDVAGVEYRYAVLPSEILYTDSKLDEEKIESVKEFLESRGGRVRLCRSKDLPFLHLRQNKPRLEVEVDYEDKEDFVSQVVRQIVRNKKKESDEDKEERTF